MPPRFHFYFAAKPPPHKVPKTKSLLVTWWVHILKSIGMLDIGSQAAWGIFSSGRLNIAALSAPLLNAWECWETVQLQGGHQNR